MKKIYLSLLLISIASFGFAQNNNETQLYYKKVIEYLASDELEGRLTGMPGELLSAKFIATEMEKSGIKPVNESGYFQEFEYTYIRIPTSNNHLMLEFDTTVVQPSFNKQFVLLSQTCDTCEVYAPVFNAGYGIEYPKLKYSDYKDYSKQDSGKIFLIKLGHPENDNPHSEYGFVAGINSKIRLAIEKGASGILFFNPENSKEVPSGILETNSFSYSIPIMYASMPLPNSANLLRMGMAVNVANVKKQGHNVIGVHIRNKRKKYIVIGAHHDHIGRAELGNSRAEGQEIHNGADDNASGVAMMLHMAKTLPHLWAFRKYNLVFVAFSGEELGLLGSKFFVNNCPIDTSKIIAMVNFDMVGRLNSSSNTLVINGIGTSPYWEKRTDKIKPDTSELKINTTEGGIGASDHTSFYLANIPAVHIFSGQHREYHMPEDDVELINYNGMQKIEDYTTQLICKIPKRKRQFTPTKSSINTPTKFKVTLGVMPDYTFGGPGMRLDNISSGKVADEAGLLRNDIITKMGMYEVSNVEGYMVALSHFNKGDTVVLNITRDGKTISKTVTFK